MLPGWRDLLSPATKTLGRQIEQAGARYLQGEGLKWLYLGLVTAATVLVYATGHAGGSMVYGEDFLPF